MSANVRQELRIQPDFLQFKLPNHRAYRDEHAVHNYGLQSLITQIARDVKVAESRFLTARNLIFDQLSYLEKWSLREWLNRRFQSHKDSIVKRHHAKLCHAWKSQRFRAPDCLVNLSHYKLSVTEENVLRCGLKHHILPKRIDADSLKAELERVVSRAEEESYMEIDSECRDSLKYAFTRFLNRSKQVCGTKQNQAFHRTLGNLASNSSIKVCSFDKGNGIVILDSADYLAKLDTIVLDTSKFVEVPIPADGEHPIITNEKSIQYYFRTYIKKAMDPGEYKRVYPTGSQPGRLYGLAKHHKTGCPLRPVSSMINTAEYNLAKYLDDKIKPHIPSRYSLSSTSDFINQLNEYSFSGTEVMVSYDVVSLFTNVPLAETIQLVADYVYKDKSRKHSFSKTVFINMLQKATGGMFLYKDQLYRQVDGVAMGSPLGPTLANFFLGHIEKELFSNIDFAPKFYARYVDDTFCIFTNEEDKHKFLDHLNRQHPNLQFTMETATNKLPFLDVEVSLTDSGLETSVYRKATHTGVFLNYAAAVPQSWKRGAFYGMLHRASTICSTAATFNRELGRVKKMFWDNGYPVKFMDSIVSKFNEVRDLPPVTREALRRTPDLSALIIKLPWAGHSSYTFAKDISRIISDKFGIDVRAVYKSCKVGDSFQLKSSVPLPLSSNVVYQFNCLVDPSKSYIGETERHLVTRASEHLDNSSDKRSAIKDHLFECVGCRSATVDNFKVLRKCQTAAQVKRHEALLIRKVRPSFNVQLFQSGAACTLKVFS